MKFGHNLPRNQVPEWAASYINYKGLKKLIKTAADASKDGSAPDLAGKPQLFWHSNLHSLWAVQTASMPQSASTVGLRSFVDVSQNSFVCHMLSTGITDITLQNSSSPSIETSKTSTASTTRNMPSALAGSDCSMAAMDVPRSHQKASTRMRYRI
jgi:hypothetical protein